MKLNSGKLFFGTEIVCSGLPEVAFGEYDPTDCTNQKVVHGSNCTLMCAPGFEVKGPTVKSCGGKKLGIWSNRSKLPKCVGNFRRKNMNSFNGITYIDTTCCQI